MPPGLGTRLLVCLAPLAFAACGGEPPPPRLPARAAPAKPAARPAQAVPKGHLSRAELERVLAEGPPWILRRLMWEEVISPTGRFTGWRIMGLPPEWSDIDLRPGDVVTRVNNRPVETPDQAWEAWKALGRARELRVMFQREGRNQELVMPIVGEPSGDVVRALESNTPPPRSREQRGRSTSVTNLGPDTPPGEDPGEWETF
jgi:hypothetical protein